MRVERMNTIVAIYKGPNLNPQTMEILNIDVCVPRPKEKIFMRAAKIIPKDPWKLEKSFFAPYKPDNDELLADCFEFDWSHMKVPKIKDPQEVMRARMALKRVYPLIREIYKELSG